jgi:UDP-glucose 4-epimerase
VIPLFHEQIRSGGPITITTEDMTRFLLSLDQAVDTIFAALHGAKRGETYIPRVPSAKMVDIAKILIGARPIETVVTGIRPGEKIHEILISEEECHRSVERGDYYAILPILPEVQTEQNYTPALSKEFSSANNGMSVQELENLLRKYGLMLEDNLTEVEELLR